MQPFLSARFSISTERLRRGPLKIKNVERYFFGRFSPPDLSETTLLRLFGCWQTVTFPTFVLGKIESDEKNRPHPLSRKQRFFNFTRRTPIHRPRDSLFFFVFLFVFLMMAKRTLLLRTNNAATPTGGYVTPDSLPCCFLLASGVDFLLFI